MHINRLLILVFAISTIVGKSQSLTSNDLKSIHTTIETKLIDLDDAPSTRPSEFILLIIEIDSAGKANKMHVLADENNKGATYSIANKLTIEIFKKYTFIKCRNKTITIPIVSLTPGRHPNYVEKLKPGNGAKFTRIINETQTAIMLSPLQYELTGPVVDKIKPPAQKNN